MTDFRTYYLDFVHHIFLLFLFAPPRTHHQFVGALDKFHPEESHLKKTIEKNRKHVSKSFEKHQQATALVLNIPATAEEMPQTRNSQGLDHPVTNSPEKTLVHEEGAVTSVEAATSSYFSTMSSLIKELFEFCFKGTEDLLGFLALPAS